MVQVKVPIYKTIKKIIPVAKYIPGKSKFKLNLVNELDRNDSLASNLRQK